MRLATRIFAIVLAAAMFGAVYANPVRADKPMTIPAWYNDMPVYVIPGVSPNVVGITNPTIAAKVANPLYVDGSQNVSHVLGVAVPGVGGYNPWWDVVYVTYPGTTVLVNYEFESEAEILAAADLGQVDLVDTGFILLCQVVRK